MQKYLAAFIILIISVNKLFGQAAADTSQPYNFGTCLYVEFLGNAQTLFSLNIEQIFKPNSKKKLHCSARTGFGFYNRHGNKGWAFNVPLELILMYGKKRHYIESSIGYTASFGKEFMDSAYSPPLHYRNLNHIGIFRLGYRYMHDGLLIRATPVFIYTTSYLNSKIDFSICLSFGIAI